MRRTIATRNQIPMEPDRGWAFAPALGLLFASGACALAHELLWTRRLIDLLGAGGGSAARVFGCFFLGLALGSAWASRQSSRITRPWLAAAGAETLVALLSLPALLLPTWTGWIWPALGPDRLVGPVGGWVKLILSGVVIVPPACAMGAVLPLVLPALLVGPARLGRQGIWLYAANTLGGVVGVVLTALVTLPAWGASGAMPAAMGGNLLVAVGFGRLGSRLSKSAPASARLDETPVAEPDSAPSTIARLWPEAVAFCSGFAVLAAEVVALELVLLVVPLSYQAPAAILATVIALLGIAALVEPYSRGRARDARAALPTTLAWTGVALVVAPLLFMGMARLAGDIARDATLPEFFLSLAFLVLISLGPAFLASGLVFPRAMAWADATRGRRSGTAGRLLAINGLGGLLGAEAAYGVLLPRCGIHGSLAVIGGLYALVGLGLACTTIPEPGRTRPALGRWLQPLGAVVFVAVVGLGPVARLPHINPYLKVDVLDERFGREGAVAVIEGAGLGKAILVSNQYILGSTRGRWEQERQAHLPLLLHPDPRSVAFIGLATGMTPGAALEHPRVESITAVELSPLVVRAADRYFADDNHAITRSRRARVVVEDGRTLIAASPGRFDVVVGDLFLPWAPGEGRLFSVEHFQGVRRSLRPGGLFCQWLPLYQLTPDQFDLIAATFARAFPEVHLIRAGFTVGQPVVGLVGFRDQTLDWTAVERRAGEARAGGLVLDPSVRHRGAVELLYLGVLPPAVPGAPTNTLGNLRLEIAAGRERITGNPGSKYLHGDRYLHWLAALARRSIPLVSPSGQSADPARLPGSIRAGLRLLAWDQEATRRGPGRSDAPLKLPPSFAGLIPPEVLADQAADWSRWPGTPPDLSRPETFPRSDANRSAGD